MMANDSGRTPPPLSPSLEALMVHERVITPQPEMVRARALARARDCLRPDSMAAFPRRRNTAPARRVLYAAAASLVLMAGAAAAYQMLRTPEPAPAPATPRPHPVHAAPSFAPAPALPTASEPAAPTPEPVAPTPALKAPAPAHRGAAALRGAPPAEELRLLVRARQADARGDYLAVLTTLSEHERTFPTGRLSEEREVLRVKALVGLGRGREARQVATSFRRHFPHSVLLHKIDDMLATLR
jgi:hypothetical protein